MRVIELIEKKKRGQAHDEEELLFLARGAASGEIPDYQLSAWLMACCLRGLDAAETAALTRAMRDTGRVLDWGSDAPRAVDKHSTGGVGDKTSLVVAPLAAELGALVPMIAGRGLGHTGGTLDKLEAIPGLSVRLPLARFARIVRELGLAFSGQSGEIAPADGRLYALRDATATVDQTGLITASILSKKLAEGIGSLVMDVKAGSGAFLPDPSQARSLAASLTKTGEALGLRVRALVTDMDRPLGRSVGNALEVEEAAGILAGRRDPGSARLRALCLELAARMVLAAGCAPGLDEARSRCERALADGSALARFEAVVAAQGGDPTCLRDPSRLPGARFRRLVRAGRSGWLLRAEARSLGLACVALGAGRDAAHQDVDPGVGLVMLAEVGEEVAAGSALAEVRANDERRLERALPMVAAALEVGEGETQEALPLYEEFVGEPGGEKASGSSSATL